MQSLLVLGRQPEIGIAELESLYGPDKIIPLRPSAVIVDVDPCLLAFDRLGGSVKFCKVLKEIAAVKWNEIENFLVGVSPDHSKSMPAGKMQLGISAIGYPISAKQIQKTAITIKQAVRKTGRSVRVIPNVESELSSAQVIHNKLTSANGWELVIIKNGQKSVIAQTVKVQDIEAYSRRDQARPARDAKVGMLPPKLAQIIINLAVGQLPAEAAQSVCDIPPDQPIPTAHYQDTLILDPFCGTGVVIQESLIMGYDCVGSDNDPRMIEYARKNIGWLSSLNRTPLKSGAKASFELGDATTYKWSKKPNIIASETFLGKPLTSIPNDQVLKAIMGECDQILRKFLANIADQIDTGTRLCLAIPCWNQQNGRFSHLPFLDSLEVIGYNRLSFKYSGARDLIYFRSNQVVARELLVITRK